MLISVHAVLQAGESSTKMYLKTANVECFGIIAYLRDH